MNWEALAAFGEVSGALAVVASLIFVGKMNFFRTCAPANFASK